MKFSGGTWAEPKSFVAFDGMQGIPEFQYSCTHRGEAAASLSFLPLEIFEQSEF